MMNKLVGSKVNECHVIVFNIIYRVENDIFGSFHTVEFDDIRYGCGYNGIVFDGDFVSMYFEY